MYIRRWSFKRHLKKS